MVVDDGRWRGDRRVNDDFSKGGSAERETGSAQDWLRFRDRVDREWRSRRSGGVRAARPADDPVSWLQPSSDEAAYGSGPAEFSVDDFRDRLFGGPGSELFGGLPEPADRFGWADREAEPAAGESFEDASLGGEEFFEDEPFDQEFVAQRYDRDEVDEVDEAPQPSLPPLPVQQVEEPGPSSGLVRPYFRTGGRTRPSRDLAVEALVSTSERGRVLDRVRVPEHRSICGLCLDTRSVAEIAAHLRLPLGVVRVLIGDVAGLGLVLVHSADSAVGDRPGIEFMERVLSGLRRI
jgi:hypothetical protein